MGAVGYTLMHSCWQTGYTLQQLQPNKLLKHACLIFYPLPTTTVRYLIRPKFRPIALLFVQVALFRSLKYLWEPWRVISFNFWQHVKLLIGWRGRKSAKEKLIKSCFDKTTFRRRRRTSGSSLTAFDSRGGSHNLNYSSLRLAWKIAAGYVQLRTGPSPGCHGHLQVGSCVMARGTPIAKWQTRKYFLFSIPRHDINT